MFRIASEEKKLGRGLHTGWGGELSVGFYDVTISAKEHL